VSAVDDLFSGEGGRPVARPRDPVATIGLWLGVAGVLNLLGVTCFTGVPGAALTIWCWHLCEEELQRIEVGVTPAERRPAVRRLRAASFAMLLFAAASLAFQLFLFWIGFYEAVLIMLAAIFGAPPP
jgi:hypothetical protein